MNPAIQLAARLIEALGGLVIAYAMIAAFASLAATGISNLGIDRMRRRLASGIVSALTLMTAATLLKTITLGSWSAIGMFAVVLALRTLVKRTLSAELRAVDASLKPQG